MLEIRATVSKERVRVGALNGFVGFELGFGFSRFGYISRGFVCGLRVRVSFLTSIIIKLAIDDQTFLPC